MKIGFISLTTNIGGGELSLLSILSALPVRHKVYPLCPGQFVNALEASNTPYKILPHAIGVSNLKRNSNIFITLKNLLLFSIGLIQDLRRENYDMVYLNNYKSFFVGFIASYFVRSKFTLHIRDSFRGTFLEKLILKRFDKLDSIFLTNSKFTYNTVVNTWNVRDVKVVYNGIEVFDVPLDIYNLDFENEHIHVGVLSRISKVKGQLEFLKSLSHLKNNNITVHLYGDIVHGEEDYFADVKRQAQGLNIDVVFHGYTSNPIDEMSKLNVVVLPTIIEEPFGRVIIEAQMLEKIIIANNKGGPLEIIEDQVNGFLVDGDVEDAYAKTIDYIISNYSELSEMRANGRRNVQAHFTKEIMVNKVINEICK